jgi:hypothetical protein
MPIFKYRTDRNMNLTPGNFTKLELILTHLTEAKAVNMSKYLRELNLYKKGGKGTENNMTVNQALLLIVCVLLEFTKTSVEIGLGKLISLKDSKESYFFDDLTKAFIDRNLKSMKIGKSGLFAELEFMDGSVKSYISYGVGDELVKADYSNESYSKLEDFKQFKFGLSVLVNYSFINELYREFFKKRVTAFWSTSMTDQEIQEKIKELNAKENQDFIDATKPWPSRKDIDDSVNG